MKQATKEEADKLVGYGFEALALRPRRAITR